MQSEENDTGTTMEQAEDDPRQYLYSSEEEGTVNLVRIEDKGSKPCLASVYVHGVPAVDTAVDTAVA